MIAVRLTVKQNYALPNRSVAFVAQQGAAPQQQNSISHPRENDIFYVAHTVCLVYSLLHLSICDWHYLHREPHVEWKGDMTGVIVFIISLYAK